VPAITHHAKLGERVTLPQFFGLRGDDFPPAGIKK